jgi:FRG domain.
MLQKIKETNHNILLSEKHQDAFLEFKAQSYFIERNENALKLLFNIPSNNNFQIDKNNFLELIVILQHFGYPTRLSDWTKNWKKALYFCLEDSTQNDDMALWCIEKKCVPNVVAVLSNEKYLWPEELFKDNKLISFYKRLKEGVYLVDKPIFNRIKAQEGILLVTGYADYMVFEDHILQCDWISDKNVIKFIISKDLRSCLKLFLNENEITKDSLYPNDFEDEKFSSANEEIKKFINEFYSHL